MQLILVFKNSFNFYQCEFECYLNINILYTIASMKSSGEPLKYLYAIDFIYKEEVKIEASLQINYWQHLPLLPGQRFYAFARELWSSLK